MTPAERQAAEQFTLEDPRVRAVVGMERPRIIATDVSVDKAEAEAYLAGRSPNPPTRRVTLVLFNRGSGEAARAVVAPSQNRVLAVQRIDPSDVPVVSDDVGEALTLAKGDPAVRRAIGDTLDRFETLEPGSDRQVPFAVQALPLRGTDPRDPCSVDRCLDLIFRTERGYLPVRARVNLTGRAVTVEGRGAR
jgi:hypothetical protein